MNNSWWNYELFSVGKFSLALSQLVTALILVIATFIISALVRRMLK